MCFKKSLFISSFLLFLISFLFSFSKISSAQTCNESGGLCIPKGQETSLCTDPKIGGTIKPFTDPNQPSGCANNGSCCIGGNNTCAKNNGTCGSASSCTNGTTDIKFLCEGGTDNVCCIPSATTQNTQTSNTSPTSVLTFLSEKEQEVAQGNNQHAWLYQSTASNIATGINLAIGNISSINDNKKAYLPGGLIGVTNNAIASLYTPPASGIQYLAEIKDNFLGKPAYAQGTGFVGLQPILPIWRGFRNVIYIISSLIFIVMGLLIMLRIKISPQAVITIQSTIPKIIITLILVTFSYAIAGLLIDLSYLIQNFAVAILFQTQGNGIQGTLLPSTFSKGTFSDYANGGMGMITNLMFKAVPWTPLIALGSTILGIVGGFAGSTGIILASLSGGTALIVGAFLGAALFLLILLIIIIIWLLQFFFGLLKCYVNIIFRIVLAPLEIGMGAFPNMKMGFSSWITELVANLAVFPISYLFLIIANIIIDKTTKASLWVPSSLSGLSSEIVPIGIGLATLALVSKFPQMIPEFIFQIKPSPWGKAIGENLSKTPIIASGYGAIKSGILESVSKKISSRTPRSPMTPTPSNGGGPSSGGPTTP